MLFGTQGRFRRLKAFFLQTRNRGHRKAFVPRKAPQDPRQFQRDKISVIMSFQHCCKTVSNQVLTAAVNFLKLLKPVYYVRAFQQLCAF